MVAAIRSGQLDIIGAARPSIADPFLPEEDRGGPARRDPRVHRLQRLHRPVQAGRRAPRLHAEPDRWRGVPARLAPRAVHARAQRGQRRARRRRRAGRDGVRDRARPSAGCAACTSSRPRTSSAARCAGSPQLPGLGEWGRVIDYRRIQIAEAARTSSSSRARGSTRRRVAEYGAEIVVVATGSRWATDGLNGWTRDVDARRGRELCRTA